MIIFLVKIADSIVSNASVVHGLMVDLRKAGLITYNTSKFGNITAIKKTAHISIYDVGSFFDGS